MAAEVDRRVRPVEVDRGTEVHILLKDGRRSHGSAMFSVEIGLDGLEQRL